MLPIRLNCGIVIILGWYLEDVITFPTNFSVNCPANFLREYGTDIEINANDSYVGVVTSNSYGVDAAEICLLRNTKLKDIFRRKDLIVNQTRFLNFVHCTKSFILLASKR